LHLTGDLCGSPTRIHAQRQVSGAGKSGSEARADAVSRRLQTLVRRGMTLFWAPVSSFSAWAPPVGLGTALVCGHHLLLGNEGIVIGMRTDPNPIDAVRHIDTQCSVVCANPHRPEIINLFEAEGGMPRIRFQKRVVLVRKIAY